MLIKEFKNLLKKDTPKHIIFLHCTSQIYLTHNQIEEVLNLKNKGEKRKC